MTVSGNFVEARDQHEPDHDRCCSQRRDALERIVKHPGNDDVYHKPGISGLPRVGNVPRSREEAVTVPELENDKKKTEALQPAVS